MGQKSLRKIKILFLLPTFNNVSPGRGVLNLAKSLNHSEFEPIICSMRRAESLAKREAEKSGIKVIELHMGSVFDFSVLPKLYQILKKEKIDILHNFGFRPEIYGGITGKLAKCKGILTTILHNPTQDIILDYGFFIGSIMNFLRCLFSYFCEDKIVAISNDAKAGLLKLHFPKNKIKVIYSTIDEKSLSKTNIDRQKILEKFGLKSNEFIVGTLSALKPRKDILTLLDAAKIVVMKFPNIKFLIIGKGPQKEKLQKRVKVLKLENHVIFRDFIEEVSEAYAIFDLLVLSSLTEGLPATLLEAMYLEIPIVATNVGGVPEIIENGISGILVPPQNPKILAEAIIKIYKNPNLAKSMAQKAKEKFEKCFTLDKMGKEYENIYKELISKK